MVMKAWKLTLTSLVFVLSVGLPKAQAISLNNTEISRSEAKSLALVSSVQTTVEQPILIAQNNTYVGADGDFEIQMPGIIKENKDQQLVSYSNKTQTAYVIHYGDLPSEISDFSGNEVAKLLQDSLQESLASEGKIISSTELTLADKYPGIELLVYNNDGTKGKYRGYIVKKRMYIMGAINENKLTAEADTFLDSFGVYLNK